ncbi:hypothetical protein COCOBI_11-0580 [Coccomyxa sp. Obi]|nr:hypothetical protein COCOBI_11-0580 [Coccomyxa sp. Obi]
MRDLSTGLATQLELPRLNAFEFKDLIEVAAQPSNVHCYPRAKNRESVDFLRQPDDMGQITINMNHGASTNGLRKAYGVL